MNTAKKQNKKDPDSKLTTSKSLTPFQQMLLKGPVIDDEQLKEYQKIISKSRKWKV
jgi:hypothetical protein